jgi:hypothetical protein
MGIARASRRLLNEAYQFARAKVRRSLRTFIVTKSRPGR